MRHDDLKAALGEIGREEYERISREIRKDDREGGK